MPISGTEMDGLDSPQALMEIAAGFMKSRALLTACELDLFTRMGHGAHTSSDVARDLGTDPRATDRLMNVLCTLGVLRKRAGRFQNAPAARRFLAQGGPESIGGIMHWVHLWESWGTLTAAVRKGRSVSERPVDSRGAAWLRAFIAAMHWRACQHAPAVVASLDLTNVARVLDVGGGSGAYAMEFVRAAPGIRATVLDLPSVLPLTAEYLRPSGLQDRVSLVEGDYNRDGLGQHFDLVLLSAIIHSNSPAENRDLFRKAVAALNPSGQLVVQDFIVDEERLGPPFGVLFALNMLVGTEGGDTYTETEVRQWMLEADLLEVTKRDMPFGTSVIVGRRARGALQSR